MIGAALQGARAAYAALDKIGKKIKRQGSRKAAMAGSKVVLRAMKQAVPVGSGPTAGLLRRSLGRKVVSFRDAGVAAGIVGPRTKEFRTLLRVARRGKNAGKPVYANPTQYSHLVDKGTIRSRAYRFRLRVAAATGAQVRAAMADAVRAVAEGASA